VSPGRGAPPAIRDAASHREVEKLAPVEPETAGDRLDRSIDDDGLGCGGMLTIGILLLRKECSRALIGRFSRPARK